MLRTLMLLSLFLQSIVSLHPKNAFTEDIESLLRTFYNNPEEYEDAPNLDTLVSKQNQLNAFKTRQSESNEEMDKKSATKKRTAHARQPYKIPSYLENLFYEPKPKQKYQKEKQIDDFSDLSSFYPTRIPMDLSSEEESLSTNVPFKYTASTDMPIKEATTHPSTKSFHDSTAFTEKPLKNEPDSLYDLAEFADKPLNNPESEVPKKPPHLPLISNDSQNLVMTEPPIKQDSDKEKLMKAKLISLILSTKTDFEKVMKDVDAMHKSYKSGTMYKIGYLSGLLKKMNIRLSKLFPRLLSKYDQWDNLRILNTFERVKSSSDLAQGMLKMMKHLIEIEQMYKPKHKPIHQQDLERAMNPGSGISWSYYDETMM